MHESSSEIGNEVIRLRAELAAMTTDRNLWQDEHNEDCPNKVQREDFERKGKELCCAYGNSLITIHDLEAQAKEDARETAEVNEMVVKYMEDFARLEAHEESNNNLLRAASAHMAAITEALGPQTHSGSIADAVKALRLAYGMALELHGCAGTNCTEVKLLADAEAMIAEITALRDQLKERAENADFGSGAV